MRADGDRRPRYDERQLVETCDSLGLRLLVAFGSRVGGPLPPNAESDLDLAVLDDEPFSAERFMNVYRALGQVFEPTIDLAFLHRADPLFRFEVFRSAVLLYGDVDDFLTYRAFAYRGFVDSQDLRDLEETLFRKKMAFLKRRLNAST